MWVKPCHRQEQKEEDIPDCLLGATITTGDGIITEDLRRQKEKLIKQTLRLQRDARRSPALLLHGRTGAMTGMQEREQ